LEDDRSFGQEELRKHGVPIIPYRNFTSFDEAIAFVKANPKPYVIKPSGEAQNIKRLLFVGEEEDGSDVIRILDAYKKTWSKEVKEFQLQKKVNGVEIGVGGFFNGHKFLEPININFEHKKLLPGNLGPSTGEMGTSMFWSGPNKLYNSTIKKFEDTLAKENYVGYFDLNCIVNGNGIYPLEFTCRFGYPTIFIQQEGLTMPLAEFFSEMANGNDFLIKTKKGYQLGVRIIVPPYPFNDPGTFNAYSKDAAIAFKKPNFEGIHIEDVKKANGEWQVAGQTGVVLTVAGTGPTMKQAQAQAYNRVKNVLIAGMYYRTDIGDRWFAESDKLHSWGYLREQ
jgi:phosphoribosylamine--glycine ligase